MLNQRQKIEIENLIRNVGDECIFPYFKNLREADVSFKDSKSDPVSIADKEAERLLQKGLLAILPNSLFIGEELFEEKPEILDYLKQGDLPVWVVDPIDGTNNFVSGCEGFGIMVCLVLAGEILSSWFYEICSKKMTVLHNGSGITVNGQPLEPSNHSRKPFTGKIGRKLYLYHEIQNIKETSSEFKIDTAKNPSIITYHSILTGDLDFLIFKITYPWDHLPGIALLSANGNVFSRWSGEPFEFSDIHEGLVVARNQEIMDLVLEQIIKPLTHSQEILKLKPTKS
jgi:fructose-1,6-bisphosphatase/inositol monophosphatase family enzyme